MKIAGDCFYCICRHEFNSFAYEISQTNLKDRERVESLQIPPFDSCSWKIGDWTLLNVRQIEPIDWFCPTRTACS